MADQFNRPYRGNDGPAPRQSAPASGGDPLAELARLIGQNDPFSDLGRNNAPARQPRYDHPEPQSDWRSGPESHQDGYSRAAPEDHYQPRGGDHYDQPQGQHYRSDPNDQNGAHAHYDAQQFGEPRNFPGQDDGYPAYGDRGQRNHEYPGQSLGPDPFATEPVEDFEEEEKPRRRSGLITAMAVLALALVGTAAAFGYRAIFSGPGSDAPPVIKADTAPAKVVPAAAPNEQSKQIYDRVGDKPQTERVVAREEAPVNVQAAVAAAPPPAPTAGAPNPIAPPPATLPPSASALAPTAPAGQISTEPKRVRTVTIRPDQPVTPAPAPAAAARPVPAVVQPAAPQPAPPARMASAAPADASAPPAAAPAAAPAPRPAATRSMAQKPAAGNAPLSLVPPSAAPAAAQPHAAPMRTAAAPAAAASHGDAASYVQVSSQRTEAEAQSSFQALRSKFPAVLGDRQPVIRRADLGDKGVFFRATVGPFGNVAQATEFCSSLKSAGGECVVQRN